jgi:DnaA family protein
MAQLPLALALPDHARFETFVAGANRSALEHVRAVAAGEPDKLWLFGPAASGKTHLLQAACCSAALAGKRAMYLALREEFATEPTILGGLENLDLLALDRVEQAAGEEAWERELFVLLTELAARRTGLIVAARTPPAASGFRLRDLASRAAGMVSYRLAPLDDRDRLDALLARAAERGLEIDEGAAEYLLNRVDRDMAALGRWLERLDHASLAEQRKVTIPFIRELLASVPSRSR